MKTEFRAGLVWCLLTSACGSHSVDLDNSSLTPSADPTAIGTVREQVMHIVVDEQRLYWSGSPDLGGGGPFKLSSCAKTDCVATLINYDTPNNAYPFFSVQNGELFWMQGYPDNDVSATQVLDPTRTRVVLSGTRALPAVTDGQNMYLLGNTPSAASAADPNPDTASALLLSVPLAGAAQANPFANLGDSFPMAMQVQGDYAYLLTMADWGMGSIQRVRTDGTGTVEVLASGFELSTDQRYQAVYSSIYLALDASYVYWGVNVLAGSVLRCPLAGCSGAPETVVAPVRMPSALLIDAGTLYFQHETDAFQYAVSSCSLNHCDQPKLVADHVDTPNVLAVDDQYLYTATTSQDLTPNDSSRVTSVAQIRRLPK